MRWLAAPRCWGRRQRRTAIADRQIAARRGEIDAAGFDIKACASKRGGEEVLWDFNLAPHRDEVMLDIWCKQFWGGEEAVIDDQEFSEWISERLELALRLYR